MPARRSNHAARCRNNATGGYCNKEAIQQCVDAAAYQGRIDGSLHGRCVTTGGIAFVADVQHADAAANPNAKLTDRPEDGRMYSQTLHTFRRSARHARNMGASCLILLGDQVDDRDRMGDAAAFQVLECADTEFHDCPVGYLLGNHDTKWTQTFREARKSSPVGELEGHFAWECEAESEDGGPHWVLIGLDCYATSYAAHPDLGQQLSMNGEIGVKQLSWLEDRLRAARDKGQHVVILSHAPLHPANDLWEQSSRAGKYAGRRSDRTLCVADSDATLRVIRDAGCVRFCIAGHDHAGAYHLDSGGIHYFTLPACLSTEGPPMLNGALLHLYRNQAVLTLLHDGGEHRVPCCTTASGGAPPVITEELPQTLLCDSLRSSQNNVPSGLIPGAHEIADLTHVELHDNA